MMITRNNYELWFLDYLEGNLDDRLVDVFLEFLRENPDLAEELRLFEAVGVTEPDLVFSDKKRLYKEIFDLPDVFDTAAIGLLEGDLDHDEQERLNNYLKHHPEKNKDLQLFKLTRLTPEPSLIFENKQLLYRQPVIRLVTSRLLRIAAVLIFLFSLSRVIDNPSVEMISDNPLITYNRDNSVTPGSGIINNNITAAVSERSLPETDKPGNIQGNGNPKVKISDSRALVDFLPATETAREEQPPILAATYSFPVNEIQTAEPELRTPAFFYEMATIEEPVDGSLSRKFFQKIGLSRLNPGKVVRWSLSLASNLTKEKFNYTTGATGEIIALNLDTRLVGLSIPVNRKQ